MTAVLILLPLALFLIAAPVAHRLVANHMRRRDALVAFVHADPYYTPGGELPDFLNGHNWPVNPNRRSAR